MARGTGGGIARSEQWNGTGGGERKEVELQPREAALGHSPDTGQPITQAGYSSSPP